MIQEGEEAPDFELPAVVDGEIETVSLEEFLGSDVVLLAFYPADFNPACDGDSTDLDDLDLFTMQKDVTVLGVSADSVYSHQAFAGAFDLHVPLLSDTDAGVAADYGVAVDDPSAGYRNERAVFVVSPQGEIEFAWATDNLEETPPVDAIRRAVDDVGGTETAMARYRVGHAHYVEARRAFTRAMSGFEDEEWMMAQSDFKRAYDEFEEAGAHFNSAVRFGEDDRVGEYYQLAEDKAELLSQAAEWLTESASAYASGEGAEGQSLRADAERTLEEAREVVEPPDPDEFPPEEDPADLRASESEEPASILPEDEEEIDTSLEVDLGGSSARADEGVTAEVDAQDVPADEPAEGGEEIDEAELEEITAELEEQTEAARAEEEAETDTGDGGDEEGEQGDDGSDEPPDDEDVELELTDPTDGEGLDPIEDEEDEDDEEEESIGEGDHGVPDSL